MEEEINNRSFIGLLDAIFDSEMSENISTCTEQGNINENIRGFLSLENPYINHLLDQLKMTERQLQSQYDMMLLEKSHTKEKLEIPDLSFETIKPIIRFNALKHAKQSLNIEISKIKAENEQLLQTLSKLKEKQ